MATESTAESSKPRVAIFLFQLGGPKTLADIEPFLEELFADVLPVPSFVKRPLARFIAKRRTPKVLPLYRELGEGSPLLANTEAQAKALTAALAERGIEAHCFVTMRCAPPRVSDSVAAARALGEGVRWVALPLYPQYSFSTTRSSVLEMLQHLTDAEADSLHIVQAYPQQARYIEALVDGVANVLQQVPQAERKDAHVLFSAHGLPEYLVRQGDPYPQHIALTVAAVIRGLAARLGTAPSSGLSYQSRVGPIKWLSPSTEETLKRLGAEGKKAVVVVPIAFVSEHIETLQELDIELRAVATTAGITHYMRVPTVSVHPAFIDALADVTQAALSQGPAPIGRVKCRVDCCADRRGGCRKRP